MWLYDWPWSGGILPGWWGRAPVLAYDPWTRTYAHVSGAWPAAGASEPAASDHLWPVTGAAEGAGDPPPGAGMEGAEARPATYMPADAKPFRAQPLKGISEETQRAHFDLYRGYVRNTNEARTGLLRAPAWETADQNYSLHREHRLGEIYNWNGAKNHEMFFSILSRTPRAPVGPIRELIERDFGSLERFRRDFEAAARVARGWAMLVYDLDDGRLHIFAGDRHDHAVWNSVLLMGIDMFEHAYFLDHRTNRDSYISAFLANLDWEAVNDRMRRFGLVR